MIKLLIEKELKTILLSPKFVSIFAVCTILILMSIFIGILDYRASLTHYETNNTLNEQELKKQRYWSGLSTSVSRYPDPMQIFVSGIHNDIGKQASINTSGTIKLYRSNYTDNTIFAVFRSMDMMFIFQIVLSLFAVLFTYDAINGEREKGTLKLSFANPVPRSGYIIAKLIGSWLGLVIPLLIPFLLGIAMLLLYRVPMEATHWQRLGLFIILSVFYFSFFICLGVLMSTLTRGSSGSFLYLLVIWVAFVLIIPRSGVMMAGKFKSVPTTAEISSKLSQNRRQLYDQLNERQDKRYADLRSNLNTRPEGLTPEEYSARINEMYSEMNKKNDEDRDQTMEEIRKYDALLNEDWRNRKAEREKLGFSLSRFSPASAYQLAVFDIAGTGLGLKTAYEDQLRNYRDIIINYRTKKEAEEGDQVITSGSGRERKPLDISDMPRFKFTKAGIDKVILGSLMDIAILFIYTLLAITGTFIAFRRYDVR